MHISPSWIEDDAETGLDICPVCLTALEEDAETGHFTCGCGTFESICEECSRGFNGPGPLCDGCARAEQSTDD